MRTEKFFNMLTHPRISQVLRHTCYNLPALKSDLSCRHTAILQFEKKTAMLCLLPCPPPHLSLFQCQNKPVSFICASNIVLLSRLWEASQFFSFFIPFLLWWGTQRERYVIQLHLHVYLGSKYPLDFHIYFFFSSSSACFHRMWKENKSDSIAVLGI